MADRTTYSTETPRCACGATLYGDRTHVCRAADRLTVTLPLVWRGDYLLMPCGHQTVKMGRVGPTIGGTTQWVAACEWLNRRYATRPAAMRAVEEAVMKALGAEGGGDE